MKHLITYSVLALCLVISSCSVDQLEDNETFEDRSAVITSSTTSSLSSNLRTSSTIEGFCTTTNLIAGQNYVAGTVDVSYDGTNLTITYNTTADWTIGVTHLSIGGCDDGSISTNGGGNPMIGQFEYEGVHPDGTHEVTYVIDASDLPDNYCFAAHAEVDSAGGGETAWAEGLDFPGNSWAMYVSSYLSDCEALPTDGGDPGDGGDPDDSGSGR